MDCGKKFMTKNGRTRHVKQKHHTEFEVDLNYKMTKTLLNDITKSAAEKLSTNNCYPPTIRQQFADFTASSISTEAIKNVQDIIDSTIQIGNQEKFYSVFYREIVQNHFFVELQSNCSTLLTMQLADKILNHFKSVTQQVIVTSQELAPVLNKNEMVALQYLSGYVLFNYNKKLRKSKKSNTLASQQMLEMLKTGRADENDEQQLIDELNRGGLWKVNEIVQKIFTIVEIEFKSKTSGLIFEINKEEIISKLIKNLELISLYENWVSACEVPVSDEAAENLLYALIKLFLTVRSFSHAKDVIKKYKANQKSNKNKSSKGLRKTLKAAAVKQ